MRTILWKLAGAVLAVLSLVSVWIGAEFGWSVFQIARGNLGVAPGDWTKSIAVPWVVVVGTFLTVLILSIGFCAAWGARECFRPGGMLRWNPRKTARTPWLSQLARERKLRNSGVAEESDSG